MMRAKYTPMGMIQGSVYEVRVGSFHWNDTAQIERGAEVQAWLETEESGSTGEYFYLYRTDGDARLLTFYFNDVNTAFNTKMRWGS